MASESAASKAGLNLEEKPTAGLRTGAGPHLPAEAGLDSG